MPRQNGTAALCLECTGLTVGGTIIPPFSLRAGQALCLHVLLAPVEWYDTLPPLLTGRTANSNIRMYGSAGYLERPVPYRRWWGSLHDPAAADWLRREKGLTAAAAERVLDATGVPGKLRVGRLGWNERTLLALEAWLVKPRDLLVFDTGGNDPCGTRQVFDRLANRPTALALLYLKTTSNCEKLCLPDATCVALLTGKLQTVAGE